MNDVAKRVTAWDRVYYGTIRELVRRYPEPNEFLPDFLQVHPRQTRIVLTPKAAVVFTLAATAPGITTEWTDSSIDDVTNGLLCLPDTSPIHLELAGMMLQEGEGPDGKVVWEPDWERLRVFDDARANSWSTESAAARANADVLACTMQRLLGLRSAPTSTSTDPKAAVASALRDLISEFERLLRDATVEEQLQSFLKDNPQLLDLRAIQVDPKVPLGSEYVTDFILTLPGDKHVLVEIERANLRLYTQGKNPSAHMTHAVQQVEDWLDWAYENVTYLRSRYPSLHEPQGLVVLGRRESLDHKAIKALRRRNTNSRIRVATYDDLLDEVRAIAANIERWITHP